MARCVAWDKETAGFDRYIGLLIVILGMVDGTAFVELRGLNRAVLGRLLLLRLLPHDVELIVAAR